jgi:aminopeptidase N
VTLSVKQRQVPDQKRPWFQWPDFFTTPVEIAITTAGGERIHRVLIDAPEKEFSFEVDSKPLIINFDRNNNIIKEVRFERSDQELAYQLLHDADVTGRLRAAAELGSRRSETAIEALKQAALRDGFWGVRLEATRSLAGFKTEASRAALVEALKDKNSRIRQAALQGLAELKDPSLADLYIATMKLDPSYFAVAGAARALGHAGAKTAYEALVELLKRDSWQDVIRVGAIQGLAALKDPRALDIGLKYAAPGNKPNVRAAAFELLAEIGKSSDRALGALTDALKDGSPVILQSAIRALAQLGDPRAIPALEELAKAESSDGLKKQIDDAINQIKGARKEQ